MPGGNLENELALSFDDISGSAIDTTPPTTKLSVVGGFVEKYTGARPNYNSNAGYDKDGGNTVETTIKVPIKYDYDVNIKVKDKTMGAGDSARSVAELDTSYKATFAGMASIVSMSKGHIPYVKFFGAKRRTTDRASGDDNPLAARDVERARMIVGYMPFSKLKIKDSINVSDEDVEKAFKSKISNYSGTTRLEAKSYSDDDDDIKYEELGSNYSGSKWNVTADVSFSDAASYTPKESLFETEVIFTKRYDELSLDLTLIPREEKTRIF